MFYQRDLENVLFSDFSAEEIDNVVVISGYLGFQPIEKLSKLKDKKSIVIYGMYGKDSIAFPHHKKYLEIDAKNANLDILYSTEPVHAKIYFGISNNIIKFVKVGSANFSSSGLKNDGKEVLVDVDPKLFDDIKQYYDLVKANCIPCQEGTYKKIPKKNNKRITSKSQNKVYRCCLLSFLGIDKKTKEKIVPKMSGLNWCHSTKGNVSKNDAYIPIRIPDIKNNPGLFPPKKQTNQIVELIWDDETSMDGLLEGTNDIDGVSYPKQLCSSPRKSTMGEYLRKRLNVSPSKVIDIDDLKKYGRSDVSVTLIADGVYYLDFSV